MTTIGFGDREDAVNSLQKSRSSVVPGSNEEAILERAMDYVLSENRTDTAGQFRVRAVTRNARFAHYRSKERARDAMTRYRSQVGAPVASMRSIQAARPGVDVVNRVLATAAPSAEDCALTAHSDFCACILQTAHTVSFAAEKMVGLLMEGYSVPEAAREVGMSRAAAYRLIPRLRAAVPAETLASVLA